MWKNVVDLSEPKPDVRAAFRVVIDNNWQGIAYLMLEVSGLDFIEAVTVSHINGRQAFSNSLLYPCMIANINDTTRRNKVSA